MHRKKRQGKNEWMKGEMWAANKNLLQIYCNNNKMEIYNSRGKG